MSLFITNTTKNYNKPTHQQCVWRSKETEETKNKKQSEVNLIKAIKDIIIWDFKDLFEKEEDCYKPFKVIFITITLNMKARVVEIKPYQWKNTLMKLNQHERHNK